MTQSPSGQSQFVGVFPWLPWPLSAWAWWSEPVRAERLAALRIGVALILLIDIALQYAPETLAYYGKDGLGNPAIFDGDFQAPRMTWSLLRGFGDEATQSLSLILWIATTLWIVGTLGARCLLIHKNPPRDDRTGIALMIWMASLAWYVASLWAQMLAAGEFDHVAWAVPLLGCSLACLFFFLELTTSLRDPSHRVAWHVYFLALGSSLALWSFALGFVWEQVYLVDTDQAAWWAPFFRSWQNDNVLLLTAMFLWFASAFLLLVGLCTRYTSILAWLLSMSFANANPHLDNAGDTIRLILLFYLMLCPCGAVWSLDALFRKPTGPVFVSPWPIRLIFVQMIFIYWINGMSKLFGPNWLDGTSLHYVLSDLALTRFSRTALPLPLDVIRVMTWSVLIWEVTFPLLVLWTWSRRVALFFGVMFHLGIFATMELGCFVPYALCMYLPLVPWEKLAERTYASRQNAS